RAQDPAEHGLRPAHRDDDQRNSDEGSDANHVDHVQRRGAPETDAADQLMLIVVGIRRRRRTCLSGHEQTLYVKKHRLSSRPGVVSEPGAVATGSSETVLI